MFEGWTSQFKHLLGELHCSKIWGVNFTFQTFEGWTLLLKTMHAWTYTDMGMATWAHNSLKQGQRLGCWPRVELFILASKVWTIEGGDLEINHWHNMIAQWPQIQGPPEPRPSSKVSEIIFLTSAFATVQRWGQRTPGNLLLKHTKSWNHVLKRLFFDFLSFIGGCDGLFAELLEMSAEVQQVLGPGSIVRSHVNCGSQGRSVLSPKLSTNHNRRVLVACTHWSDNPSLDA